MADKFPAVAEKHVNNSILRSLIRVQDRAKRNAPFGTSGNLRQNWVLQMGRFRGSLGSGAKAEGYPYGTAVEFGTKPHYISVKDNIPFQLWAKRKGINPYAVARSIQRKGTKGNPFFQKSVDDSQKEIDDEIDKAIDAILKDI